MASKELMAASSRPLVLSILSERESYGYEIIKRVVELSQGEFAWTEGMLYPVLHRLEREGLIKGRWIVGANGRKRKYYRVSAIGKKQLKVERQQWETVDAMLRHLWGGIANVRFRKGNRRLASTVPAERFVLR